jgi:hypothetical protein
MTDELREYYGDETYLRFTPSERDKLSELHQGRTAGFDAIASRVAVTLGYDPVKMTQEQKRAVEDEVEELTENWDEADVELRVPSHNQVAHLPPDDLTRLLAEYHDQGLEIMNILDEVAERGDDDC